MAAELESAMGDGVSVELVEGGGGVFDVRADGEAVFNKWDTGRFPRPGEIGELLAARGA